jgi:hypothetical protein
MSLSPTFQRPRLRSGRKLSVVVLALGLSAAAITPATAAEGAATGSEVEIDSSTPPMGGPGDLGFPFCARAKDGDKNGTLNGVSAQYKIDAELVDGDIERDVVMTITTGETFFYGPQGTHSGFTASGRRCGADNLGDKAPVPATITIEGDGVPGTCTSTTGSFSRTQSVFQADATFDSKSCPVKTVSFDGRQQSTLADTGLCAPGTELPCIVGVYTQQ